MAITNTYQLTADIKKRTQTAQSVTVTENDSVRFELTVTDNGAPITTAQLKELTTATLASTRPDGQVIVRKGRVSGSVIVFEFGNVETAVVGKVGAVIQLYTSDKSRVSTISFQYEVVNDPTGDTFVPLKREQTLIESVIHDGPGIIQSAKDAAEYANATAKAARTNFLPAVKNVSERDSKYATPGVGDLVRVTSEAKTYRYSTDGWIVTDEYDATAIDEVSAQLAQTTYEIGYGVVSGGKISEQVPANMTVKMESLVVHTRNGKRFEIPQTNIAISPSHPTLRRRDLVGINNQGEIQIIEGVVSMEAPPPETPSYLVPLAIVTMKEGFTNVPRNQIRDIRVFKMSSNQIQNELENVRSNNAKSIRPSDGIVTQMLNNAQSYASLANREVFEYGSGEIGIEGDTPPPKDGAGKYLISCSVFNHLMAKGISFENSKYNGLTRNVLDPNFNHDYFVNLGFVTFRWGEWAFKNGYLFEPNEDWSNVQASDHIFISYKNPLSQLENRDMAFMNLDHSCIFVKRFKDGSIEVYEQASRVPQFRTYTKANLDTYKIYICRLPYNNIPLNIENIVLGGDSVRDVTGSTVVGEPYRLNKKLKQNKWYTAVIKADIRTPDTFMSIRNGGDTVLSSGSKLGKEDSGLYYYHFTTGDLDISANDVRIMLHGGLPLEQRSVRVEWFVLTEGFTYSIKDFVNSKPGLPTINFVNGFTGHYHVYSNDKEIKVNLRVTNPDILTTEQLTNIAEITGVKLVENLIYPCEANIQHSASPSYSKDCSVWVATDSQPYLLRVKNGTTPNQRFLDIAMTLPIG